MKRPNQVSLANEVLTRFAREMRDDSEIDGSEAVDWLTQTLIPMARKIEMAWRADERKRRRAETR